MSAHADVVIFFVVVNDDDNDVVVVYGHTFVAAVIMLWLCCCCVVGTSLSSRSKFWSWSLNLLFDLSVYLYTSFWSFCCCHFNLLTTTLSSGVFSSHHFPSLKSTYSFTRPPPWRMRLLLPFASLFLPTILPLPPQLERVWECL
jgi:hypothetical protein